ncbi:hypothetical protein QQZ08_005915 [Neonectria magnoliae]|uniref:Flavin-containing monooxygenase n=1 Tax=Neonectria magnoliae TaxID=2732573 RepID=A0ABR1I3Q9_9HYPO
MRVVRTTGDVSWMLATFVDASVILRSALPFSCMAVTNGGGGGGHVKIQRGDDHNNDIIEEKANIFVNASGVLNKWKRPAIKGRESFKGQMLHSANWDNSVELKGKRIGVIGGGFCKNNVSVVSTDAQTFTAKGIKTADGVEHEFDVIVCATGFDVSWRPAYPTISRDGVRLGTIGRMFPTLLNGLYGPYGHGSFLPITETVSRYAMQMLKKKSEEEISSFALKEAAVDDFAEHCRKFLPRTAWTYPCRSWFK